jgi:endoglucanase
MIKKRTLLNTSTPPLPRESSRTRRRPLRRLLVAALLAAAMIPATIVANPTSASADTSGFRGMNWAVQGDNFTTGLLVVDGLTSSDSYATVYSKANTLYDGMANLMGVNTVRLPVNTATVGTSWWANYRGAIDAATDRGFKVILGYWEDGAASGGVITNTSAFTTMWNTIISQYGSNSLVYFEPMNEPHGYSSANWLNFAASWLSTHSTVPKGRVLIGGTGYSQDLNALCSDSRFNGTLLSIHYYVFFYGNHSYGGWEDQFLTNLGNCASRAVLTEFGADMHTQYNYNDGTLTSSPSDGTNNWVTYLRAVTDTTRSLNIGSVYWPAIGGKPHSSTDPSDWYAMFTRSNLSLSINNCQGADRVRYGWGDALQGCATSGGGYVKLKNRATNQYLDGMGRTTDGADAGQWASSSSYNQQWLVTTSGSYVRIQNRATGLYLDGMGRTTNGANLGQWANSSSTNQQWTQSTTGGYLKFQNRATGLFIDGMGRTTNGDAVGQWASSSSYNQQWLIVTP